MSFVCAEQKNCIKRCHCMNNICKPQESIRNCVSMCGGYGSKRVSEWMSVKYMVNSSDLWCFFFFFFFLIKRQEISKRKKKHTNTEWKYKNKSVRCQVCVCVWVFLAKIYGTVIKSNKHTHTSTHTHYMLKQAMIQRNDKKTEKNEQESLLNHLVLKTYTLTQT